MLDAFLRPYIDRSLSHLAQALATLGATANQITLLGFLFGLAAMVALAFGYNLYAFLLLCVNRFCDGLDGAVARHSKLTDFGGFLDIVCDFIIYSGIVFAFALANPENALAAAFLIFSFIGPITSFLAYAIIASKRKKITNKRGRKSFYYLGGICEGTETFVTLSLICLCPDYFNIIAIIYGVLCWITTLGRVYDAWIDFGDISMKTSSDTTCKTQVAAITTQAE